MATVEGVPEVNRALDQVAAASADMTETNRAIAQRIVPRARALAPTRTGALAGSLEGVGDKVRASITSRLDYSVVQEFGSPRHHILGIHYAERAVDAGLGDATQAYQDGVERATKRAGLGWQG